MMNGNLYVFRPITRHGFNTRLNHLQTYKAYWKNQARIIFSPRGLVWVEGGGVAISRTMNAVHLKGHDSASKRPQ